MWLVVPSMQRIDCVTRPARLICSSWVDNGASVVHASQSNTSGDEVCVCGVGFPPSRMVIRAAERYVLRFVVMMITDWRRMRRVSAGVLVSRGSHRAWSWGDSFHSRKSASQSLSFIVGDDGAGALCVLHLG